MFVGMIEPITTIAGKMWIGLISTRDNQGSYDIYDRKPHFIQVLRKVGKVILSIVKSNLTVGFIDVYSDSKSTYRWLYKPTRTSSPRHGSSRRRLPGQVRQVAPKADVRLAGLAAKITEGTKKGGISMDPIRRKLGKCWEIHQEKLGLKNFIKKILRFDQEELEFHHESR